MVDITKIKIGDEVTVRLRVTEALGKDGEQIRAGMGCKLDGWLWEDEITTHTPAPEPEPERREITIRYGQRDCRGDKREVVIRDDGSVLYKMLENFLCAILTGSENG